MRSSRPRSARRSRGRCARAGPAAATLRTAAVLGATVDVDLLAEVTGDRPADLLDHLEEGVRRRLLVEEGSFEFSHALVREALASTVGATRTAFIHRQAGRALSRRPEPDAIVVAGHARLGGDRLLASNMLIAAARAAVARFSQDSAAGLLDDAIELHDSAEARVERARVLSMLMRYADARAAIDVAQSPWGQAPRPSRPGGSLGGPLRATVQRGRSPWPTGEPSRRPSDESASQPVSALGGWVSLCGRRRGPAPAPAPQPGRAGGAGQPAGPRPGSAGSGSIRDDQPRPWPWFAPRGPPDWPPTASPTPTP